MFNGKIVLPVERRKAPIPLKIECWGLLLFGAIKLCMTKDKLVFIAGRFAIRRFVTGHVAVSIMLLIALEVRSLLGIL
jgi:hypothetical protein